MCKTAVQSLWPSYHDVTIKKSHEGRADFAYVHTPSPAVIGADTQLGQEELYFFRYKREYCQALAVVRLLL
jgi:hypothetical protein